MEPTNNIILPVNEIITPDAIANWPPAIGWWLLLLLVVLVLFSGMIFIVRYRRYWTYRKLALNELKTTIAQTDASNISTTATELMSIIKRVSMTVNHQHNFAMLDGERFLNVANNALPKPVFSQATINNIAQVLYRENPSFDINAFYHECCHWVKRFPEHYNEATNKVSNV